MTFNRAFKDIFGTVLYEKEYNYSSKLNRFIKVYNNELVYSVTYRNIPAVCKGKRCFTVTAGIRTIFYETFDKWGFESTEHDLLVYYLRYNDNTIDNSSYIINKMQFIYDEVSLCETIEHALSEVVNFILPILDMVNDLTSYVNYAKRIQMMSLKHGDRFLGDSLVLFLNNNHEDFEDEIEMSSKNDDPVFIRKCIKEDIIEPRERVYNDKILLERAFAEAKKRRKCNLDTLCKFKLV